MHHQYLREWLRENRMTLKDLGAIVGRKNLSIYTSQGKPFPIEWLLQWQRTFGWTDAQLFRFSFGRVGAQPLERISSEVLERILQGGTI